MKYPLLNANLVATVLVNCKANMEQQSEDVLGKYGIDPDRLMIGDVLSGEGAFGVVRKGFLIRSSDGENSKKKVRITGERFSFGFPCLCIIVCVIY